MTPQQLRDITHRAVLRLGGSNFWLDRETGVVCVSLGITIRDNLRPLGIEEDQIVMVRYYPHGEAGYELCAPLCLFLERHDATAPPQWRGTRATA